MIWGETWMQDAGLENSLLLYHHYFS